MTRSEVTRIETLDHHDARIIAQDFGELAMPDIDRNDALGAAFKQDLGKAARRCANVETVAPLGRQREMIQRMNELEGGA